MTRHELDWTTALTKYASTVELGGTKEERAFAWAQANTALDTWIAHDLAELKRRAKMTTVEIGTAA